MKRFYVALLIVLFVGRVVAQTDDDSLAIITPQNAPQLVPIQTIAAHTMPVSALAFRPPDGAMLASTGEDLTLRLWDVLNGELLIEAYPHNAVMNGLAFTPDGTILLTGSWDRTVRRHQLLEDNALDALPPFVGFNHIIDRVRFSPDGAWLGFAVGNGSVHLLNAMDFDQRQIYPIHALTIQDLAFLPTGEFVVATGFPDDSVLLGVFSQEELLPLNHNHAGGVLALAVSPVPMPSGGALLVTAGDDSNVHIWQVSVSDGVLQADLLSTIVLTERVWFTAATFNPAGDVLALSTREGDVYLYDMSQPNTPQELIHLNDESAYSVNTVAFNPAGTQFATGNHIGQIVVWGIGD
jgi:WD40 repeat protein